MNTHYYFSLVSRSFLYSFLILILSCTDHEIQGNLPESGCKAVDGSARQYPCEFIIEKITFLAKDGSDLGIFTASEQTKALSRFQAKSNTYTGNVAGQIGIATFDIRVTLKRVANPSFPVNKGYLLGYTHNTSGKNILHTPKFAGDTYGERDQVGSPVTLDMPIGESRDLLFDMIFPYTMTDFGSGVIRPVPLFPLTSIFIDNDVTTLKFDRNVYPYTRVGSVAEAYYEKLMVSLSN